MGLGHGNEVRLIANGAVVRELIGHLSAALKILDDTGISPHAATLIDHASNLIADTIAEATTVQTDGLGSDDAAAP